MLRQRVQQVVEKADSRVNGDLLGGGELCRVRSFRRWDNVVLFVWKG
jgi:hypothetical protein